MKNPRLNVQTIAIKESQKMGREKKEFNKKCMSCRSNERRSLSILPEDVKKSAV